MGARQEADNRKARLSRVFRLRIALRRFGIDSEKDTQIIATGENPQRLAALSRGIMQYSIMGEPVVKEAEKLGFRDRIDL